MEDTSFGACEPFAFPGGGFPFLTEGLSLAETLPFFEALRLKRSIVHFPGPLVELFLPFPAQKRGMR